MVPMVDPQEALSSESSTEHFQNPQEALLLHSVSGE